MPHARAVHGHLAGTDAERAADVNAAWRDPNIGAVWCLRGGAGALRLLPLLDFAALAANPKPFIGYSDATALHCAIQRHAGVVSFLGPVAIACEGAIERAALLRCISPQAQCVVASASEAHGAPQALGMISLSGESCVTVRAGRARGRLVGGNLTVLLRTLGTPYEPNFDGAILVLEDVAEPPYRIDNMLTQLRLAGKLHRVAGIVFGSFTGWTADDSKPQFDYAQIIEERCGDLGVPLMTGMRCGHNAPQVTLPLGLEAVIDAELGTEKNTGAGTLMVPTPAVC